MIYLTSDLHGKLQCLLTLLDKAHFFEREDNWLYILGDVIDRNLQGGVDILKWLLLQPNVQLLLGNHEQMLLSNRWLFEEVTDQSLNAFSADHLRLLNAWKENGAQCTMDALSKESPQTRADILEYLEDCPLAESVVVNDKAYLLVHGGLGNFSEQKKLSDYTPDELLWARPALESCYFPERFTVIVGHTPTDSYGAAYKNRMIRTKSWWNIDTGAAAKAGRPMLLCLDTQKEYYIEDDGSVITV